MLAPLIVNFDLVHTCATPEPDSVPTVPGQVTCIVTCTAWVPAFCSGQVIPASGSGPVSIGVPVSVPAVSPTAVPVSTGSSLPGGSLADPHPDAVTASAALTMSQPRIGPSL